MKINWKIRFKNKVWLLTFVSAIVTFVYQVLSMFDITPKIDQQELMNLVGVLLTLLSGIGVIIDPTTKGTGDSARAMTYGKFDYDEHAVMGQGTEGDTKIEDVE